MRISVEAAKKLVEIARKHNVRAAVINEIIEVVLGDKCGLCGHSFEENQHGLDQDDLRWDGNIFVHDGYCKYCMVCNPGLRRLLESFSGNASV